MRYQIIPKFGPRMEDFPKEWNSLLDVAHMHPQYYHAFVEAIDSLFCCGAPLTPANSYFIALMAACRHRCQYLIDVFTQCYLNANGDPEWLRGLKFAPQRFTDLDEVNKFLAHQPWLLQAAHVQELTKAGSNWSLSELAHGLGLLSHVHALCSFVYGCGVTPDSAEVLSSSEPPSPAPLSQANGNNPHAPYDCSHYNGQHKTSEVEELLARLKELNEPSSSERISVEEKLKHFIDINSESSELSSPATLSDSGDLVTTSSSPAARLYTVDPKFGYVDFLKRGQVNAPTIKSYEYRWEDQGYGQLSQLNGQLCTALDDKFTITKSLTYNFMGSHQGVDTRKYRIAIWNYIQSLFGIRHDDYDYAEVNQMLNRQMKTFIKTVCCFPERTTELLRSSVMKDFKISEKVHVNIIIAEARLQAEFLYGLRAITRFMTSPR